MASVRSTRLFPGHNTLLIIYPADTIWFLLQVACATATLPASGCQASLQSPPRSVLLLFRWSEHQQPAGAVPSS